MWPNPKRPPQQGPKGIFCLMSPPDMESHAGSSHKPSKAQMSMTFIPENADILFSVPMISFQGHKVFCCMLTCSCDSQGCCVLHHHHHHCMEDLIFRDFASLSLQQFGPALPLLLVPSMFQNVLKEQNWTFGLLLALHYYKQALPRQREKHT